MSTEANEQHLALYVDPGEQVDDDELDRVTRRLLAEIQELDVDLVELVRDEASPEGTKSAEAITIGALAMAILPSAIPPFFELLKAWSLRGDNRKVKIKTEIRGQPVELEYSGKMSPAELESIRKLLVA